MQTVESPVTTTRHPLDPLTADEVEAAAGILKAQRRLASTARFVFVTLNEPDKATVLGFQPGQPIERQAFVILWERAEHTTFEAVVSITAGGRGVCGGGARRGARDRGLGGSRRAAGGEG